MAELYAWASFMMPFVDHAYVTSSAGHRWGCFGGTQGGREIGSGPGDAGAAQCISPPDGEAGVQYGVTGVCHQAANRILWPAGVVVSKAGGYAVSSLIYGAYGTPTEDAEREWQALTKGCSADQYQGAASRDGEGPSGLTGDEREYAAELIALHAQTGARGSVTLLTQETMLLMRYRLPGVDTQLIESVREIQKELLVRKKALDTDLLGKQVGGAEYAVQVNNLINEGLNQLLTAMGPQYYEQLFGLKPGDRCAVVIPEIAAQFYK